MNCTALRSWEMNIDDRPSSSFNSCSRFSTRAWMETSRLAVGSSKIRRVGSTLMARAIATRCFSPPLSSWGLRSRQETGRRTRSTSCSATFRCVPGCTKLGETNPRVRSGSRRESYIVSRELNELAGFWNTTWRRRRMSRNPLPRHWRRGSPSSVARPAEAGSRVSRHLASVDLPDPLSPTTPRHSPLLIVNETPLTAWVPPG